HGKGPRQRWKKRFLIDALRSALFNAWLSERIERGWFESLVLGDIARKCDTGGLFEVVDLATELQRFHKGEIAPTGPIFGTGMQWATGEPGNIEREILAQSGISEEMLQKARANGTRRVARITVDDLQIEAQAQGLWFSFTLPPGSYATTVLREFMKEDRL
ncbi:MAG: tRNA pseudouridine(13) synthase TruD, partial [bacterium]